MTKISLLSALFLCVLNSSANEAAKLEFANGDLTRQAQLADPYMQKILREHEQEFPGAMRYPNIMFYTHLNRISTVQQSVLLELHNETDFAKRWQSKKEMHDITATVTGNTDKPENVKVLNEFEWRWQRGQWASAVSRAATGAFGNEKVLKALVDEANAKIAMAPKSSMASIAHHDAERALVGYVMAASLTKSKENLSGAEAEAFVRHADIAAMDYLHDPISYRPFLEKLDNPEAAEERLKEAYEGIMGELYKESESIQMKQEQKITLREVHPNIAIFRGYVGNDCSTSFSPGFVFTPSDRYYYIFDEDGKSLGYLGLTLVTIDSKPAAFIHTIQGPDITATQTELAMRAMTLAAPQIFGTDLVVLGPDESISSNVNFFPIKETMTAAVSGKKPMKMAFDDKKIRHVIASLDSTLKYDDPETNHSGRKLEFDQPELVKIEVANKKFDARFLRPKIQQPTIYKSWCESALTGS